MTLGKNVDASDTGYYTVIYTADGLNADGKTVEVYTTSFRVFVSDNPCVPNPTIDPSIWPANKRSTTLAVLFGETQNLQLTGVSNGACKYSFSSPTLVNSADSTLFGQFSTPTTT